MRQKATKAASELLATAESRAECLAIPGAHTPRIAAMPLLPSPACVLLSGILASPVLLRAI